jgi:hypothetical protein
MVRALAWEILPLKCLWQGPGLQSDTRLTSGRYHREQDTKRHLVSGN